jgi:cell division protein ZapA (FtsZ GTPase activity inhibitor)
MKSVTITVAGQVFKIKSDADDKQLRGLAAGVTERFQTISKKGTGQNQEFKAMAMVAMGLLDELTMARAKHDSLKEKASEFSSRMIDTIDELLARKTL